MIKKLLVVGILTAFIAPNFVFAAPTNSGVRTQGARTTTKATKGYSLADNLGLTFEQRERANEIRISGQDKIQPYFDQVLDMQMVMDEMNPRSSRYRKLEAEIKVVNQKIEALQIENEREFMQILTPSQRSKYIKIKEDRKRRLDSYRHM